MDRREVSIIGAGPAGVAAAVQLKRYGIDFILFEREKTGGLANSANLIENYPGIPFGIDGRKFSLLLADHLNKWEIEPVFTNVNKVELSSEQSTFMIGTGSGNYYSDFVIAATGTRPVIPDLIIKRSMDIDRDIFFDINKIRDVSNKRVAILGGGDAAFDYSLSMNKKNSVSIIHRSAKFKALPLLRNRVKQSGSIEILDETVIRKIDKGKKRRLLLKLASGNNDFEEEYDILICAIGRSPEDELFAGLGQLDNRLFFAGDVRNGKYRQASIAAGDGLKAAMKIFLEISK